jgi:hypothetical protein
MTGLRAVLRRTCRLMALLIRRKRLRWHIGSGEEGV